MSDLYVSKCYCTNLRRSANAISEFYDKRLEKAGVTTAQYYLLINLQRLGKANITHWAERVGLERSTMVRNIKLLEDHGFIERTEGNGKTFTLSEYGENVLSTAVPIWNETQHEIESFLGMETAKVILQLGVKLQELKSI